MPKSVTRPAIVGILFSLLTLAGCSIALPSPSHSDSVPEVPQSPWGSLPWGGLDFVQYYVAWELAFEGKNPYDQELAGTRQKEHGRAWGVQMFSPPWGMLPSVLVSSLPFTVANYGNIALNIILLLLCAVCWTRMLFPGKPGYVPIIMAVSLVWVPGIVNMAYGQNALWPLAGFTGWLWFTQRKRYAAAGWWLALTVIKPHLGLLPVVFAMVYSLRQRHWSTLATAAGGVLVATLVTFLIRPAIWSDYSASMQTGFSPSIFRTYTLNGMALPYFGPAIQYVTYALLLAVIYSITVRTWKRFTPGSGTDEHEAGHPTSLVTWSLVVCMMVIPFATYAWLTDFVVMVPGWIYVLGQGLKKERLALVTLSLWIVMNVWLSLPDWKESYWLVPWIGWGLTLWLLRTASSAKQTGA